MAKKIGKHIQVYRDRGGERFRYRLVSARAEVLANAGQSFAQRWNARRAARREHPGVPVVSVAK